MEKKTLNVGITVYMGETGLTEAQLQAYFADLLNNCDKIKEIKDFYIEAYEGE